MSLKEVQSEKRVRSASRYLADPIREGPTFCSLDRYSQALMWANGCGELVWSAPLRG